MSVGGRLDRFLIEAEIGRGGFGTVYRARHEVLGTRVALKILHPEHAQQPEHVERLLREARAATSIGSPHIVRVVDAGRSSSGVPFLAMELLEGEDLAHLLQRRGRLPLAEALEITRQVLAGLGAAHAAGIVHRDLKPANVFLANEAGGVVVKILDFGISKIAGSALTAAGMVLGTPAFMAPEQLLDARAAEPRSDLYSAAAILYLALADRLPWEASTLSDFSRRSAGEPPVPLEVALPGAPVGLSTVLQRALATDPSSRYSSADELHRALATAAGVSTPPAVEPGAASEPPSMGRAIALGCVVAAILAISIGVGGVLAYLWHEPAARPGKQDVAPASGGGSPIGI